MAEQFSLFERLAKSLQNVGEIRVLADDTVTHPFDERNIHPSIASCSQKLFDDGHYSQATFEAFKLVDNTVKKIAASSKSGKALMMEVFKEDTPAIKLTEMLDQSQSDEQEGFKFLFAGSIMAIRNPRGHEVGKVDHLEECLDHLGLASLLMRRIDKRFSP